MLVMIGVELVAVWFVVAWRCTRGERWRMRRPLYRRPLFSIRTKRPLDYADYICVGYDKFVDEYFVAKVGWRAEIAWVIHSVQRSVFSGLWWTAIAIDRRLNGPYGQDMVGSYPPAVKRRRADQEERLNACKQAIDFDGTKVLHARCLAEWNQDRKTTAAAGIG